MKCNLFLAAALTLSSLSLSNLQAQVSPSSTDKDPESSMGMGSGANFGQMMNQQTGSMHFYGKVAMGSGSLPWDPIPILVVCDGKVRLNLTASAKGDFDIVAPARRSELVTEKKDVKRVIPSELVGCQVSASLDGFTSTKLTIANRSLEDDPSIGTIVLRVDEFAKGSIVSPTTLTASKDAAREFEKAHDDFLNKHADSARRHLEKAVALDPQFAEAWYHLGKLEETSKPQDALTAYNKAVAADPKYIPPYEGIAAVAAPLKKWQDVVDATNHSLELNPAGTPQIWYYNAVGNLNIGNKDAAEKSAETSLGMDPSHIAPNTEQLLAVIEAGRGEYKAALTHLRNCLTYTPPGPNADLMKQQIAQLEKVVPAEDQ